MGTTAETIPRDAPAARRAPLIAERLAAAIPNPRCELRYGDAWQLLVATVLSAQSTDRTINKVTPVLFERWPTPAALASAPLDEIEQVVRPTGFFRRKAKAIRDLSAQLVERFGGEVPRDVDALVTLPGVARKTANVVLTQAYGLDSGFAVDTHVARLARRLALTEQDKPDAIERDLMALFPRSQWAALTHRLVLHGRHVCKARKPRCEHCPLNELCPSAEAGPSEPLDERIRWERELVEGALAASLGT